MAAVTSLIILSQEPVLGKIFYDCLLDEPVVIYDIHVDDFSI